MSTKIIFKKKLLFLMGVFFAFLVLLIPDKISAQIDTSEYYDDESDLFDSTANYREMYKDLDKDGEWIKTTKGELEDMVPKDDEEVNSSSDGCCRNQIIWVWRPRVYYMGWTPYCNGRWYYTIWGWFWYSFYDWGWACYHHGRWVYSEIYGWIWIPGRVWAPSWVDWCYTGAYVGWYPRYPYFHRWHKHRYHRHHHHYYKHWTFIEKKKFAEELITKENIVDADYNQLLISKSNIGKESKYNEIIINQGPSAKNIEKTTNERLEPKVIKYTEKEKNIKIDDNSITVYKPKTSVLQETVSKDNSSMNVNKEKKKEYNNRDTESKNVEQSKKQKEQNYDDSRQKNPYENKERENKSYENKERENKSYEYEKKESKSYENKQKESKPRDENRNYKSGERKSKENNSGNHNNNSGNRNNNSNSKSENNTNSKRE